MDVGAGERPELYPYTEARMRELLREDGQFEDFTMIAKAGFGHVRIPIDPLALNMRQDQPIPDRYKAKANAPLWGPLLEDIKAAQDAGLAVILDFHPVVLSAEHQSTATKKFWKNNNMNTAEYTYPGTYSYPFLEGTGSPSDALSIFWKSFVTELEAKYAAAGSSVNRNWVYLEILNEPFEPIISAPGSDATVYLAQFLPQSILLTSTFPQWRQTSISNFHNAVRSAINEIQSINDNYYIIVPNYVSLPFGPMMYYQQPNAPSYYTQSELRRLDRLVYTWHFYEPMKFTHYESHEFEYYQDRDWFGQFHTPETPNWSPYDCDGLGDKFLPPVNLGNQSIGQVTDIVKTWSENVAVNLGYQPMMYIGEFGCEYKLPFAVADQFVDLPGGPTQPPAVIGNREKHRYQWLYDIRTAVEGKLTNAGWGVYAYVGYMPIFRKFPSGVTGDLYAPTNFAAHGPDRGEVQRNTSKALFGNVRPDDGGL